MSIYDNNKELLSTLGVEGNYSTDFEVRKAILNALGGDASTCNSIYEVDLEILRIYQEGGGGGDISLPEQIKSIICNEDGTYTVTPDEGYTLSRVEIEVDAALPEQTKTVTYSENGSYTVTPDEGYTLSQVDIEVNVEGSGGLGLPEQTKSVTYTESGSYTVTPDEGYTLSNVDINVNVINPVDVWVVPNGTKFNSSTWSSVPAGLGFSNVSNFSNMFSGCSNLTSIPYLETSKGTSFNSMFYGCKQLTTIPLIDTGKGNDFGFMFQSCTNLTNIPLINTSKGTSFIYMFTGCTKLTTVPQLDMSNGTDFRRVFEDCTKLTTVPQLDMSNGKDFTSMFEYCTNLTTVSQLVVSKGTDFSYMFYGCAALENITFAGSINANIDFNDCTKLTYESVKSILTACSNTTNTNSKTVTFKRTLTDQNSELTNLIATCNTKGWTISGLTLQ